MDKQRKWLLQEELPKLIEHAKPLAFGNLNSIHCRIEYEIIANGIELSFEAVKLRYPIVAEIRWHLENIGNFKAG